MKSCVVDPRQWLCVVDPRQWCGLGTGKLWLMGAGSLAGQWGETTQTHPSRDTRPRAGSLKCGFLMQLFDKYLSLVYCEAIRTASEVALHKSLHQNKTYLDNKRYPSIFPLMRTLLKAYVEAGVSKLQVDIWCYLKAETQHLCSHSSCTGFIPLSAP